MMFISTEKLKISRLKTSKTMPTVFFISVIIFLIMQKLR